SQSGSEPASLSRNSFTRSKAPSRKVRPVTRPTNGIAGNYRVAYPEVVRAHLRTLGRSAAKAGRTREVAVALRKIDASLRTDPVGFGDPNYHLPHLGLLKC